MMTSFLAIDVNVTEEVRVTCGVGEGSEGVRWEWRVNSSEVVTSGRILYDRTGTVRNNYVPYVLSHEVFCLSLCFCVPLSLFSLNFSTFLPSFFLKQNFLSLFLPLFCSFSTSF